MHEQVHHKLLAQHPGRGALGLIKPANAMGGTASTSSFAKSVLTLNSAADISAITIGIPCPCPSVSVEMLKTD